MGHLTYSGCVKRDGFEVIRHVFVCSLPESRNYIMYCPNGLVVSTCKPLCV